MSSSTSVLRKIHRCKASYLLLWCLILLGICVVYLFFIREVAPTSQSNNEAITKNHALCVLVPYRERFEDLLEFVPHMSKFLNNQSIKYYIIVVDQIPDGYRFNKGAVLNAGFHIVRKKFPECDYVALNDIDTLPLSNEISYAYPGNDVHHLIPNGYHPVPFYSYPLYIGGILLISNEVYSRVNGYGNNFWGWGVEGVDFYRRLIRNSVQLTRPDIKSTNRTNSFKHTHGKSKQRDVFLCPSQLSSLITLFNTDRTGLNDVNFTIASEKYLTIEGFPCYIFNININCIFEKTPWCRPFCIDDTTTMSLSESVLGLNGEFIWSTLESLVNMGLNTNTTLLDKLINLDSIVNSGILSISQLWDRLDGQANPPKK